MSTSETQSKIIDKATELFNERGVKAVSVNHIADSLNISRGNLHYHFRTKNDLIAAIFDKMARQMAADGAEDSQTPTLAHMKVMFERYMATIWAYRFLYRELTSLLRQNPRLRQRYVANRQRRLDDLNKFFSGLVETGALVTPPPPVTMDDLVKLSWMVCDNWLAFVEAENHPLDSQHIQEGYNLILSLFLPYSEKHRL